MKKVILFSLFIVLGLSLYAVKVVQIGNLNMISTRNVNPNLNYQVLSTFKGSSEKELKRSKCETIEDAIEKTVKSTPGGEFLMNAKIYSIGGKYFAVQGDVWGNAENVSFKGFKMGDRVTWKVLSLKDAGMIYKKGVIKSLKNEKECIILADDNDKLIDVEYEKLSKSE